MDVTLMRLLWAVVTILSGIVPGIVAYLVAWIIMPEEPETAVVATGQQHATST
jgi:phage shock protein PspC (stress-responsive transcriptional regulator)